MRAPIRPHPAWLQIGMTVIGGIALGLLILQVVASREHGFMPAPQALFQAPPTSSQPGRP